MSDFCLLVLDVLDEGFGALGFGFEFCAVDGAVYVLGVGHGFSFLNRICRFFGRGMFFSATR